MENFSKLFETLDTSVFLIKPINNPDSNKTDGSQERILFLEVLMRAVKDLEYLFSDDATNEQKSFGRSALTWIFIERTENIPFVYTISDIPINEEEDPERQMKVTSFDSICRSVDLDPQYLREVLIENYDLPYMKMFL